MRLFLTLILTSVLLATSPQAEPNAAAARGVISAQIDAFKMDDLDRAFTYASPMIQGLFGTPQRFGEMVQQGYPMVWRPGAVRFLDFHQEPVGARQNVLITDEMGRSFMLEYQMLPTADGWQINGVRFLQPPQLGAYGFKQILTLS